MDKKKLYMSVLVEVNPMHFIPFNQTTNQIAHPSQILVVHNHPREEGKRKTHIKRGGGGGKPPKPQKKKNFFF